MAILLGIPGVLVGLGIVVAAAVILEDYDIDLMRYRKGPILVGMSALVAMVGGYSIGAWMADLLFGKRVDWTVPAEQVELRGVGEKTLDVAWTIDGAERKVCLIVGKSQLEHMRALGRELRR